MFIIRSYDKFSDAPSPVCEPNISMMEKLLNLCRCILIFAMGGVLASILLIAVMLRRYRNRIKLIRSIALVKVDEKAQDEDYETTQETTRCCDKDFVVFLADNSWPPFMNGTRVWATTIT